MERSFPMKSLILFLVATLFSCFCAVSRSEAQRFSNNNRRAVLLEAFYALRPSDDGGCDKTINGDCVGSWNFLDSDYGSYLFAKDRWYGCNSSAWAVSDDTCFASALYGFASFYSDVFNYGLGTFNGNYGPVGRGGQSVFFANLLLLRSKSHELPFPSLAEMWANTETNLQRAVEGDVLLVYNFGLTYYDSNHVAIIVEVKRAGNRVTALDVIDSNYISDFPGAPNREVIARHLLQVRDIQGMYRIWRGTAYYHEPYNPNE
jgi:hypothetical protein